MDQVIDAINGVLWGSSDYPLFLQAGILGVLLIGAGLYFTVLLGAIQFRRFPTLFKVLGRGLKPDHADGVSPFAAFATSLAARVGAGNIAGVAIAITLGGPGAVFWMWLIALIGMATAMVEATLAQVFKQHDYDDGEHIYRGGPAYYMERGLNARWLGVIFSLFLLLAFPLVFNMVQANTLADAMGNSFGTDDRLVAGAITVLTALVIFGGVKRITTFAGLVMPVLALAYLLIGLAVVVINFDRVPALLADIVSSAFGPKEAAGGFAGYTVAQALIQGIKRGLFSNEAGLGSAPNAAAAADTRHPGNQGFIQSVGVFADTIVICTITALIILLSENYQPGATDIGIGGAAVTQNALADSVGAWGSQFIAFALVFFCFTSVIANYYYGQTALLYLNGSHRLLVPLRLVVLVLVFVGALLKVETVWNLADTALGLMAVVNLVAIVLLARYAIPVIRDFDRQLRQGLTPEFDPEQIPGLSERLAPGVWSEGRGKQANAVRGS